MTRSWWFVALLCVVGLCAERSRATPTALAPLGGSAQVEERARFGRELRAAIEARGLPLLGEAETADALATSTALEGPCALAATACLARIAATAAVDRIVGGALDRTADGLRASLSLVSTNGAVVRSATVVVPDVDGPERADAARTAAVRLFAPTEEGSFLEVITVKDAAVFVDGKKVGFAPLQRIKLEPGRHTVELVARGYQSAQHVVEVRLGQTTRLDAPLLRDVDEAPVAPQPPVAPDQEDRPPPATTNQLTVAVLGIENRGDEDRAARWLANALAVELRKRERLDVVDRQSGLELFDALGPQLSARIDACAGRDACVRELAQELAVDVVIVGALVRSPTTRRVTLRAVPLTGRSAEYQVDYAILPSRPRMLADVVGAGAAELFPEHGVREGERVGASVALRHALDPPPVRAPLFIGAVGLTMVSFVAAGTFGAMWIFGPQDERAPLWGVIALSATGAGVGAGAIAAVMAPFTDWGPPSEDAPE